MSYERIIPYTLPKFPAKHYSDKALEILKEIESECPSALPIFIRSDIAITLSGVRTYDAYVGGLSELLTVQEIQKVTDLLARHNIYLNSDRTEYVPGGERNSGYYLINEEALKKIPEQYKFEGWVAPNPPYNVERLIVWQAAIEERLHYAMIWDKLPHGWSHYIWTIRGTWEGMFYGFPAPAITAYNDWDIAMIMARNEDEEPAPLLEAEIAYRGEYFAPHVSYSYPKELEGDEAIQKHKKLWSEILTNIYESEWHKKAQQSATFKQQLEKIAKAENKNQA